MEKKDPSPHGQKRRAEDDLKAEQRLAKRFDMLNLQQNGHLYVPVSRPLPTPPPRPQGFADSMHIDDTKDKVYIHNLDDELSDIEAEEERMIFLPDIEKKLGKIPNSVFATEVHPSIGREVVLYTVPSSLSVPQDQDNVRKAIIESRQRAREKSIRDAKAEAAAQLIGSKGETSPDMSDDRTDATVEIGNDEDAMDLG